MIFCAGSRYLTCTVQACQSKSNVRLTCVCLSTLYGVHISPRVTCCQLMHMQGLWKPQGCLSALTAWLPVRAPMLILSGKVLFDIYLWIACLLSSCYERA